MSVHLEWDPEVYEEEEEAKVIVPTASHQNKCPISVNEVLNF